MQIFSSHEQCHFLFAVTGLLPGVRFAFFGPFAAELVLLKTKRHPYALKTMGGGDTLHLCFQLLKLGCDVSIGCAIVYCTSSTSFLVRADSARPITAERARGFPTHEYAQYVLFTPLVPKNSNQISDTFLVLSAVYGRRERIL